MNNSNKTRNVRVIPPEEPTKPTLSKIKETAGGWAAVLSAGRHIREEMGLIKGFRVLAKVNQKGGVDCPGCAWPDPEGNRASQEYCENGAKAIAEEATEKRVTAEFFARHSVEELSQQTDFWLGKRGRLTEPMVLKEGEVHYQPISWAKAFAMIGQQLNSLSSPDQALFYTSGRTSNEAAFMYQLFVRQFGTNNLPDCSNMCHESSGFALKETIGIGKGTVTLEDIHQAEVIVVIGQNPGTNHPRMLTALRKCKKNGGNIVSINPLPETGMKKFSHPQYIQDVLTGGTSIADYFLQVRINGDVALLKAIMYMMWQKEVKAPGTVFDHEFINQKTAYYQEFIEHLQKENLGDLLDACALKEQQIKEVVDLLVSRRKIIFCWAMGLTQHENAVGNIKEIVNLLLLKGSIGKPGSGVCPVRGHSNVQGDRTMGIHEDPPPGLLDKLEKRFSFSPPKRTGLNTVQAIKAMLEGKARVFISMGGNFTSATPDSELTAKAIQNCSLTVQISTKLNRAHLITGNQALILPCLSRTELDEQLNGPQFLSVENSMSIVHSTQGFKTPASEKLLSEPAIVAGIAKSTLNNGHPDWEAMTSNYDIIRDHIEQVIPGFESYNQRIRNPEGFSLPNSAREGRFETETGKAHFSINHYPSYQLQKGQYIMMSIRSHDQFNTTIYGLDDRYRGIHGGRRVVFINPNDLRETGMQAQQLVDIVSHFRDKQRKARSFYLVPFPIARKCVAAYFPEANVLVPLEKVATGSFTPSYKSFIVTLESSV